MTPLPPRQIEVIYPLAGYLKDHHIDGQPVLPAAEALHFMANQVRNHYPTVDTSRMTAIEFTRLLPIDPDTGHIAMPITFRPQTDGRMTTELATLFVSKNAEIKRTITHARATYGAATATPWCAPKQTGVESKGDPFIVSPRQLYEELVPLGPAFQNVAADIALFPDAARSVIKAPVSHTPHKSELAAAFVLDAAFHVACAWGQRYRGIVAYPVAIVARRIWKLISPQKRYRAMVTTRNEHPTTLNFDVAIHDMQDDLCESVTGLKMRVMPQTESLQPPKWLRLPP
jgi:hypothetical protein